MFSSFPLFTLPLLPQSINILRRNLPQNVCSWPCIFLQPSPASPPPSHRGPTPGEIQGSVYVSASFSPPISPLPTSSSSFTAPVGMLSVSSQQQTENSRGHHLTTPPGLHQTLLSRLPAPQSSMSPVASSLSSFFLHASSSAFLPGSTQQLEESF